LRLASAMTEPFGNGFDQVMADQVGAADAFYRSIIPAGTREDGPNLLRQSYVGMLWGKRYFSCDTDRWLEEHGFDAMRPTPRQVRNREWFTLIWINLSPDRGTYDRPVCCFGRRT
jgi:hypothetical protein